MRFFGLLALLVFIGCSETEEPEWNQDIEIGIILAEDRRNKELELMYLEQIRAAQENEDQEAFEFYLEEYFNVPRLDIPEDWKSDPRYFEGGNLIKY